MELKSNRNMIDKTIKFSFNRTFMELKFMLNESGIDRNNRF